MLHQNALRAYQNAEQNFLVDGADPHRLVQILFEELLTALQRCDIAMEAKDLPARSAASSKALSIIYVLGSSLDFEKGGEIAESLAQLYDWARLRLIAACRTNSREELEAIRKVISDIAEAWVSIAAKAA
jgi:flagellar protein FliS